MSKIYTLIQVKLENVMFLLEFNESILLNFEYNHVFEFVIVFELSDHTCQFTINNVRPDPVSYYYSILKTKKGHP